jgi:hypothetical protein
VGAAESSTEGVGDGSVCQQARGTRVLKGTGGRKEASAEEAWAKEDPEK